jgi:hypothetical protein
MKTEKQIVEAAVKWINEETGLWLQEQPPHMDNTDAECWPDLHGHHCCYVCSITESLCLLYLQNTDEVSADDAPEKWKHLV